MDFRRWFTALAVLALFAGLASAQVAGGGGTGQLVCNSVAQVTPQLRSEGVTELVGDIVISCTGGTIPAANSPIPTANITVSLTAPVTSRLMNLGGTTPNDGRSEALLLIDEPGSGLPALVPNWGPAAPQTNCSAPADPQIACAQIAAVNTATGITIQTSAGGAAPINVFQGILVGTNQVQFRGVPILPTGTSAYQRVFRITNIRVNASAAGSSIVGGVNEVRALISTSNPAALPISAVGGFGAVTVGYVQPSLTTGVTPTGTAFTQCNRNFGNIATADRPDIITLQAGTSTTDPILSQPANVALLSFRELFPSAFKVRGTSTQNVPGQQANNTESGLTINTITAGSAIAGYADTPTRFQAVFSGLPAGVQLYVTNTNVVPNPTFASLYQAATTTGQATLVGTSAATGSSVVPAYNLATLPVRQIAVTSQGTATAVWQVNASDASAIEDFRFGVLIAYTPNTNLTQPGLTAGTASVTLSYNPLEPSSNIPRFINTSAAVTNWLMIVPCQTVLLFPYVTSRDGFNTGIAISNTSEDPLDTQTATGTCSLNFYGRNAPAGAVAFDEAGDGADVFGPLNAAETTRPTWTVLSANVAPNFQGYVFAVCNFQFARGLAIIMDNGADNIAHGYLALVVNNGVQLNQRGHTIAGESLNN